jgi:hypothetical protein
LLETAFHLTTWQPASRNAVEPVKGYTGSPMVKNADMATDRHRPILREPPRTAAKESRTVIERDRNRFLDAVRRLAAKDHNGLTDPEDVARPLASRH